MAATRPKDWPPARTVWCDESGYTGADLLNREQPLFTYAAHDLTAEEAAELVDRIRRTRRREIQAAELKAGGKTGLRRRGDWAEVAAMTLEGLEGRLLFVVTHKRLALAGKIFDYVIEPVVADKSRLFYGYRLHRLVAAALYRTFARFDGPAEALAVEFREFMRTFDPADAPHVFGLAAEPAAQGVAAPENDVVLGDLLRFARGYRERIAEESDFLREPDGSGKWQLDLSTTALWSLLSDGFGHRHERIELVCDESGPLKDSGGVLDVWIDNTEGVRLAGGPYLKNLRLNLAGPIVFGRSIDHPALQIADVAAGMAAEIYGLAERNQLAELKPAMDRHMHRDFILPSDDDPLDPEDPLAQTNLHVLRLLADRAEVQADPTRDMEKILPALLRHYTDEIVNVSLWREINGDKPVPPMPDHMRPRWR